MALGLLRGRCGFPGTVPLSFNDHFSQIAARYAAFRPHYPAALASSLAALAPARDLAWDAGCGNGQLSVQLAEHFARVIATEPSRAQLDAAEPHAHVEYRCAKAEDPILAAASVDLAVAAQAAHWFDWPRYVAEVARVTKPGALVALVSYGILHVPGDADSLVARYYHDDVGAYWPAGREHVENGYRDLTWPWPAVDLSPLAMTADWTRDELLGYVATWSATVKRIEAKGRDAYDRLGIELARVWPDGERRTIHWPLTVRAARRP